jgi:hypothetical protein
MTSENVISQTVLVSKSVRFGNPEMSQSACTEDRKLKVAADSAGSQSVSHLHVGKSARQLYAGSKEGCAPHTGLGITTKIVFLLIWDV